MDIFGDFFSSFELLKKFYRINWWKFKMWEGKIPMNRPLKFQVRIQQKNSSEQNFNIAFKHTIINPSHKLISNQTIDFSSQNTERKRRKEQQHNHSILYILIEELFKHFLCVCMKNQSFIHTKINCISVDIQQLKIPDTNNFP